tara:strand:- start:231 stop:650 length:420 start_codon:yes stop_codon:yes gene_type:complete
MVIKNQLFRKKVPLELVLKILNAFGLKDFEDRTNFSRKILDKIKTVDKIKELKPELEKYYLPCKSRTYLSGLNNKNVITILRQCCKLYNYIVISREKYSKGEKFINYNIQSLDEKKESLCQNKLKTVKKCKKSIVINFD